MTVEEKIGVMQPQVKELLSQKKLGEAQNGFYSFEWTQFCHYLGFVLDFKNYEITYFYCCKHLVCGNLFWSPNK